MGRVRRQVLDTAEEVFQHASQQVSLTNMSGRRDMSLLLALSASQAPPPPLLCCGCSPVAAA